MCLILYTRCPNKLCHAFLDDGVVFKCFEAETFGIGGRKGCRGLQHSASRHPYGQQLAHFRCPNGECWLSHAGHLEENRSITDSIKRMRTTVNLQGLHGHADDFCAYDDPYDGEIAARAAVAAEEAQEPEVEIGLPPMGGPQKSQEVPGGAFQNGGGDHSHGPPAPRDDYDHPVDPTPKKGAMKRKRGTDDPEQAKATGDNDQMDDEAQGDASHPSADVDPVNDAAVQDRLPTIPEAEEEQAENLFRETATAVPTIPDADEAEEVGDLFGEAPAEVPTIPEADEAVEVDNLFGEAPAEVPAINEPEPARKVAKAPAPTVEPEDEDEEELPPPKRAHKAPAPLSRKSAKARAPVIALDDEEDKELPQQKRARKAAAPPSRKAAKAPAPLSRKAAKTAAPIVVPGDNQGDDEFQPPKPTRATRSSAPAKGKAPAVKKAAAKKAEANGPGKAAVGRRKATQWTDEELGVLVAQRAQGFSWRIISQENFPSHSEAACSRKHKELDKEGRIAALLAAAQAVPPAAAANGTTVAAAPTVNGASSSHAVQNGAQPVLPLAASTSTAAAVTINGQSDGNALSQNGAQSSSADDGGVGPGPASAHAAWMQAYQSHFATQTQNGNDGDESDVSEED